MSKKQKTFPYHLHISRALLASLCLLAIGILHAPPSLLPIQHVTSDTPQVLAYATNISRADLLAHTNNARAANGLANFTEDARLDAAAQLKANDMIANNYWSHTSPSGVEPWYWFTAAGYDYTKAGENLAYGFSASDSVVTAWMNSPGHRANILGTYQDVGFGIANGESYQGNQNTVVVAHYGAPRSTPAPMAPAAPTAPSTPSPPTASPVQSPTTPSATAPTTPAETPTHSDVPANETTAPRTDTVAPTPASNTAHSTPVTTVPTSTNVPVWRQLLSGQAPLLALISLSLLCVVGIGYAATHVSLIRRAAIMGEQYVLHHPVFDASFVIAATAIVLFSTIGKIG